MRAIRRAYRTQAAWTSVLYRALVRLFNLHFVVDGDASCVPGPVVVLVRHASIIDTLVPSVFLTARHGLKLRFVLKRELLVDPCLDIAGLRLPNHFVSRSGADGERERAAIEALARGMTSSEGALIYPEGTRMTPVRKLKALERLGAHQDLYARAAALLHVMPPRTGGTLALLHGAPTADVVIVAHRGLEGFAYVSDLWRGDVVGKLVHVHVTRVPRAEIPASDDACTLWLYDVWAQMDAWIDDVTRGLPRPSQQLRQ
jgi:1-acyl-sn-glycerol-3-phosphate acyltransferase